MVVFKYVFLSFKEAIWLELNTKEKNVKQKKRDEYNSEGGIDLPLLSAYYLREKASYFTLVSMMMNTKS